MSTPSVRDLAIALEATSLAAGGGAVAAVRAATRERGPDDTLIVDSLSQFVDRFHDLSVAHERPHTAAPDDLALLDLAQVLATGRHRDGRLPAQETWLILLEHDDARVRLAAQEAMALSRHSPPAPAVPGRTWLERIARRVSRRR